MFKLWGFNHSKVIADHGLLGGGSQELGSVRHGAAEKKTWKITVKLSNPRLVKKGRR